MFAPTIQNPKAQKLESLNLGLNRAPTQALMMPVIDSQTTLSKRRVMVLLGSEWPAKAIRPGRMQHGETEGR
jgi:hypothetical protein